MNEADKNKGFSLIELVVTIAVMGIVVLISVNLYWMIQKADVESAAENIDSALSSLRSKTLSKGNEYMLRIEPDGTNICKVEILEKAVIVNEDGSVTEDSWKVLQSEKLKGAKVSGSDGAGNDVTIEDGCMIEIQCSKSNGSYTRAEVIKPDATKINIVRINISKAERKKVIKLVIPTGRHYID
ncbi:MAG: type II secretion system protein [Lachnospiraceae bacterium]|nr:type II secretion system protein [Lachnospiraceae bacterium]